MLCLEARGGRALLDALLDDLRRLGQDVPESVHHSSLPGARYEDGTVALIPSAPDLPAARRAFRASLAEAREWRRRQDDSRERHDAWTQTREKALDEERRAFAAARRGLLRLHFHGGDVAGCILMLADGEVRLFPPGTRPALRESVTSLDVALGIDPQADFERLDADRGACRFIDLTPPFRAALVGRRQRKVSIEEAVRMTVHWRAPLASSDDCDRMWTRGDRDALMARLVDDARTLHAWYRYGVTHDGVRRPGPEGDDLEPVVWNLGRERTIYEVLKAALETRHPVALSLLPSSPPRPFLPRDIIHHGLLLDGRWLDTDTYASIPIVDVASAETNP